MFKFIHAADIHLDSPLRGLSAYEGAPTEMLRGATRSAFRNLVDVAIEAEVAFLLLAGDLYDGTWPDFNTGLFFISEMQRLRQKNIRVFIVYGNHDAESELTRRLTMPDNVHEFRPQIAQTVRLDALKVVVHGQSFRTPAMLDNLVPGYPEPLAGWLNIGMLHTAIEGNAAHAPYAPCSVHELLAKGYDYWALGHVHAFDIVHSDPWIVFPGNLQGRHVRETGAKGAVMVTVDDGRIEKVERILTDVLRWAHLQVDVSASGDAGQALGMVGEQLAELYRQSDSRSVAVRVTLTGETALHGALFNDEKQIAAETRGRALEVAGERMWIEKVRIETTPLPKTVAAGADALATLDALLDEVINSPDLLEDIDAELRQMFNRLPPELRESEGGAIGAIREQRVHELATSLRPTLTAWLEKRS